MSDAQVINYAINDPIELNLSYMPFIDGGALFIPSFDTYSLGDRVLIDLLLPGRKENLRVEGKVIWITPQNALHHVLPGIGIQFVGGNAQTIKSEIEAQLDKTMGIGGYTYGITDDAKKEK